MKDIYKYWFCWYRGLTQIAKVRAIMLLIFTLIFQSLMITTTFKLQFFLHHFLHSSIKCLHFEIFRTHRTFPLFLGSAMTVFVFNCGNTLLAKNCFTMLTLNWHHFWNSIASFAFDCMVYIMSFYQLILRNLKTQLSLLQLCFN